MLSRRFRKKLVVNGELTRQVVSFQASKTRSFYRWFNYREAFSPQLVQSALDLTPRTRGRLLDPFSGAGTAVTVASAAGWDAVGIELMPVGIAATEARLAAERVSPVALRDAITGIAGNAGASDESFRFQHVRITQRAFSRRTERELGGYLRLIESIQDEDVRYLCWFVCVAVLESVSYTRKDGQYLRWDRRSGRELRSDFHKGPIASFWDAALEKLTTILVDVESRPEPRTSLGSIEMTEGSCLEQLPKLPDSSFDLVMTSPPYCNRYDYTRTYALELAFLGLGEAEFRGLRQTLLSATVENKSKRDSLCDLYSSVGRGADFARAVRAFEGQAALHEVLDHLRNAAREGALNNQNIPNLVENYFFEMNLVIHELARVLRSGGRVFMVNDNVRYHGQEVPVDLILSDFAESAGLAVDTIWVLPRGKGNSSQQMGAFGRQELRKGVYVWSKQ